MKPRVLTVANQKGGVGKTTTAINLGTALAAIGERVLLIDLDPQGNASTGLGVDSASRTRSSYDVLLGEMSITEVAQPTDVPRVSIVPATMDLLGAEITLAGQRDRTHKLRAAIEGLGLAHLFPTFSSIARRRSICSPSMRWQRPMAFWSRCNANSSHWKGSASCSKRLSRCAAR